MNRRPAQLGSTFRIDYADPIRWRSQSVRLATMRNLGMDTSWIAPAIEAAGTVTASGIDAASRAEAARKAAAARRHKKKKGKKAAEKPAADDAADASPPPRVIPWGPIALGAAGLAIAAALLLRKPARATPESGAAIGRRSA